ncbi:hypothetical protein FPV58_26875 [Mycolicibacterium porcinum]|uniref:hypothetical protein n=1 Tax=Mycolicibacterium porcinum TaxID=39693 RepID=UPI001194E31E|nr:hypothetical protein [Mycolicibacterium porcinum]TVX95708.1 hypothetical protein FPV58_26875 [Mycolicibacterium porcinum]
MPSPTPHPEVILVLDAGTDEGYVQAHVLLQAGHRVGVTARHVTQLTRIIHGFSSSQVFAIAADTSDPSQLDRVIDRAQDHFSHAIDRIVLADRTIGRLSLAS